MSSSSKRRIRARICGLCAFVSALLLNVRPAQAELPGGCETTLTYCVAICTWSYCDSFNGECPLIGGDQSHCDNTACNPFPWPWKQWIQCYYGSPR